MKRSETPAEDRARREAYIETRWKQLSEVCTNWGDEAIKYLLFVNAGAMAGALSFIGAMPHIRDSLWPKLSLSLFAIGVALVGVYHAARYHRTEWLFGRWRTAVAKYKADQLEWNDLLDDDDERVGKWNLPLAAFAYASLLCFFAGLAIAAINFNDITNAPLREGSHARTQTDNPAPRSNGTAPRSADPQRCAETGQTHCSTERAGAGPGSASAEAR